MGLPEDINRIMEVKKPELKSQQRNNVKCLCESVNQKESTTYKENSEYLCELNRKQNDPSNE